MNKAKILITNDYIFFIHLPLVLYLTLLMSSKHYQIVKNHNFKEIIQVFEQFQLLIFLI